VFSELVIWAVKAFIYNELILELGASTLYYGHNISKMEDIINGWETAGDEYDTFRKEKYGKVSFFNDDVAMSEYISLSTGGL